MSQNFTNRFIDAPASFAVLHEKLKRRGFVTYLEEPDLSRPDHNSLTNARYQSIFEKHYPAQYTEVHAEVAVFENGSGYPDFYVVYDSRQFKDSDAVEIELKRLRILK